MGVAATALGAAGCGSGAVDVTPPSPAPAAAAVCAALHAALPTTVAGAGRRATSPSSSATAAWGDPAIVLTCGVGLPALLDPTSPSYDPSADDIGVNGVDWLTQQFTRGYRFTTTGRAVFVQVDVPSQYAPEVNTLVPLAAAVSAADPVDLNVP